MPVSSEKSSRKAVGFRLLLNAFWEIRSQRRRWRSALFRDPGRALVARLWLRHVTIVKSVIWLYSVKCKLAGWMAKCHALRYELKRPNKVGLVWRVELAGSQLSDLPAVFAGCHTYLNLLRKPLGYTLTQSLWVLCAHSILTSMKCILHSQSVRFTNSKSQLFRRVSNVMRLAFGLECVKSFANGQIVFIVKQCLAFFGS